MKNSRENGRKNRNKMKVLRGGGFSLPDSSARSTAKDIRYSAHRPARGRTPKFWDDLRKTWNEEDGKKIKFGQDVSLCRSKEDFPSSVPQRDRFPLELHHSPFLRVIAEKRPVLWRTGILKEELEKRRGELEGAGILVVQLQEKNSKIQKIQKNFNFFKKFKKIQKNSKIYLKIQKIAKCEKNLKKMGRKEKSIWKKNLKFF